ncbi:MAG: hypothetical protein KIS92_21195, partial [Planctomycetota bacterium]|nr:hypothetical protein [Planctomycetota bacterium]
CAGLESPWMGRMQPPPPRAEQRDGYRRALEHSPDDPDFLYPYARVCLEILRTEGAQAPAEVRADFDAVLASMKAQNPNDYRMPWLEGERAIVEGDLAAAADALDLAVERAPAYLSLRLEAATTRLNGPFAASRPMSVKANEELARILAHLRLLLKLDPTRESTFVGLLRQAGALPVEIAELWPKDDPESALPRARYWAALRNWDLLGVELKRLNNVKGNLWLAALNGRLAFERGNLELGVKEWKKALEYAAYKRDQDLERWLSAEVPTLPMPAVMALYQDALKETGGLPQFALVVTARLVQDRKLAAADSVLLQASQRAARPEIFRAWAELALKLGDRDGAFSRARTAVQMSGHAQEWRAWLKAFEEQNRN